MPSSRSLDGGGSEDRSKSLQPARSLIVRVRSYIEQNELLLWWIHSAWAFLFGIGVMFLGAREPGYVRFIVFQIGFIWLTSLFLPVLVAKPWLSPAWASRIRLLINYFNKNFYQQLLFFVIPIYYASTTFWSRNVVFLALLSACALLSTLDVIYDRYLSARWRLAAAFLAFNTFASVNAMLLVIWAIGNSNSLYLSALAAMATTASMLYRFTGLRGARLVALLAGVGGVFFLAVRFGAPFIPPATLSLGPPTFGRSIERASLRIVSPLVHLPTGYQGRIIALTPIRAPFGLTEGVRQLWYADGTLVTTNIREHQFTGGRKEGYRYWNAITLGPGNTPRKLRVDVETSLGQLIGRAELKRE